MTLFLSCFRLQNNIGYKCNVSSIVPLFSDLYPSKEENIKHKFLRVSCSRLLLICL